MSETYTPIKDLQWKTVPIHRQGQTFNYNYELELPRPLADWDVWDYWERERIDSMREHIKWTDTLWEVGAESGWMAALFSKYLTPNLVLIEPTAEFWPGIKAIFDRNNLPRPKATFQGFLDNTTTGTAKLETGWPTAAAAPEAIDKNKYRNTYSTEDRTIIKSLQGDKTPKQYKPDAIAIDVEGAELLVLQGMTELLKTHRPKLWISIHPDMMERDYQHTKQELLDFLENECGYELELLAIDHEEHWQGLPK